jgi:hypothetical protein
MRYRTTTPYRACSDYTMTPRHVAQWGAMVSLLSCHACQREHARPTYIHQQRHLLISSKRLGWRLIKLVQRSKW